MKKVVILRSKIFRNEKDIFNCDGMRYFCWPF